VPAVPQGPSATARAWNGHPGFRFGEKAQESMVRRLNVLAGATTALLRVQLFAPGKEAHGNGWNAVIAAATTWNPHYHYLRH